MSDTSTRSGMLWEVERILKELKETDSLPQVLLMENVPQVHSVDNTPDFNKWQLELSKLGYKNYWEDLIATDYGIPQTRNRCFMVSILGDYNYSFPRPIKLEKKLKDMLEDNVDEKYYLSDKQIKDIQNWNAYEKPLENMEKTDKNNISPTLTTRSGAYAAGMVLVKDTENYIEWEDGKNIQMNCRAWKDKVGTLNTGGETKILIKNNTKKGYLEATDGDGVDISGRMEYHRGTVQKQKSQTIKTMGGEDVGVVVKTIGNYTPSNHNASRIVDQNYSAPTVMENHGTITATQTSDLRIRKLTPKECFRLMGVKDEDFEKCAKNQSDSSLYHLAGDSIVVNVLMAIFSQML